MRASGGSLLSRWAARLRAALGDDGERCRRCGVCHNVCGLMGREPGWLHKSGAASGAAAAASAGARRPHPDDAKAQED